MTEILDRIRASLVGLRMPRALEALDHTLRRLERGEVTALEDAHHLLGRRLRVALPDRPDVRDDRRPLGRHGGTKPPDQEGIGLPLQLGHFFVP